MKPVEQYPTAEAMENDLVNDPKFVKIPREKRQAYIEHARDLWIKRHAAMQERDGGATEADLQHHIKPMLDKIIESITPQGMVNRGRQLIGMSPDDSPDIPAQILETLAPHDLKQLMIDLALFSIAPEALTGMAAMNAVTRLALRVGIPTVAGAVGGAMDYPKHPISGAEGGAERGFGQAIGGEILGGLWGRLKDTLADVDYAKLGGWIDSRLGTRLLNKAGKFDMKLFRRLFRGGDILPTAQAEYKKVEAKVVKALGPNFRVTVARNLPGAAPALPMDVTLPEAVSELDALEQGGWDYRGDPARGHTGRAVRDQVHEVEGDIAGQIDKANKKAGTDWYTARQKVRTARTLKQLFSEPDIIANDKISVSNLQKYISDAGPNGYKIDLQQAMGDSEQQSLSKTVHRGAAEGQEDRPAQSLFKSGALTTRGGFFGRVQMPWPSRHVGNVPFDLGRGRALTALITLGPYQLIDKLGRMTELPQGGNEEPKIGAPSVVPGSATIGGEPAGPTEQPNITPPPTP